MSLKCTKHETERFITSRRRRPNGHWCIWQRQGQTRQRQARTRTRIRLNVGTVESADTTRKTVGARRTLAKVVREESTIPRMQRMLTILTRNHQMLNQKSTSGFTLMLMLLKCEGLNGSRLESTQVQERRHGSRVSDTGRSFLAMLTHFPHSNCWKTCQGWQAIACRGLRRLVIQSQEFEVFKRQSVNHCCLLENTRRWVVSLSCVVTERLHVPQRFECCEENGCLDPEGVERFTIPRLHSCVQRKQRVQHLHETCFLFCLFFFFLFVFFPPLVSLSTVFPFLIHNITVVQLRTKRTMCTTST